MQDYCYVPPSVSTTVPPNVLIILDNSNSMDEDFYGNAVGSYASNSKSVVAKKTIRNLIDKYKRNMRVGLMTYRLGNAANNYHIHNSPYFVSYDPKSYCPNPPPECVEYCRTDDTSKRDTCNSVCQAQNPSFDATYRDEIITAYAVGSSQRNKYCNLVYPKTQAIVNPSSPTLYMYTKQAFPFYATSNQGNAFCYSSTYSTNEYPSADSYACYRNKTNTSDANSGYSTYFASYTFYPTDTDYALGYLDFGRRLSWYYVGRTWFLNSSPGNGYLHVPVNYLVDSNGNNTSTFTSIWNKLDPKENDEAGYMSCNNSDRNTCPYIINAGLTPIPGTLQTAIDYFKGTSSPIQERCQKNFIILVTDGLPSVDENGTARSAEELMPTVLTKLENLRNLNKNLGGTSYTFDIKTYVIGVGLSEDAKAKLNPMAVKGGTDVDGKAYYADDPDQLYNALNQIFIDILRQASSGSTVATLASRTGISSIVVQPYYYPKYVKDDGSEISWLGFLRSFWVDLKKNLREDSVISKVLNIAQNAWDKIIQFITVRDETKIAVLQGDTDIGTNACTLENIKDLNQIKAVFDCGCQLANANPSSRNIKFNNNGTLSNFDSSAISNLKPIWQTVDSSIDDVKAGCILRYLRGENLANDSTCSSIPYVKRSREININNFGCSGGVQTWKLGDIIHSSPSVVSDQPVNIYHKKYNDLSYQQFINETSYKNRPSLVFVGANDGMLHAFRVGTIVNQPNLEEPSKLQNAPNDNSTDKVGQEEWAFVPKNAIPYLLWYGKKDYCHVPTVDYRTIVVDAKIDGQWRTLLIGTMGFGGKALPETSPQFSSSIFVLDITNPISPSLKWEKSLEDNTLTLSFPAVVKVGDYWYVVAGTGPKDPKGTSFKSAKIYFYNLSNGNLIKTLNLTGGISAQAVGDIMPIDVDFDYSDDAIYFGTYTETSGNFFRISLKSGSGYKSISALTDSDITMAVNISRPIFGAPNFTKDELDRLWIYFGTGRFLGDQDKTISYTNYLVGYKDACWSGSCSSTYNLSNFTNTTSVQTQATVSEIRKICSCTDSSCGLVDVVYDTTPISSVQEVTTGWYYSLPNEAIFSQPVIYAGIVDALSFKPPQDVCAYQGDTNLLVLYYKSGTAYPKPGLLSTLATSGTQGIITIYSKVSLGKGVPPFGNPFQISSVSSQQYVKFIQLSSGIVLRVEQKPSIPLGRFISWIEK